MIENTAYVTALGIIAACALLGVFSHKFDDNLLQRFGLSMACIGAVLRLTELVDQFPGDTRARYLLTYGIALFCVGTTWKFWRKK
ncbi:MAG: hypothetical protein ACK5A0_04655 [Polaromonas sp.]|jgi:hypothetical protein